MTAITSGTAVILAAPLTDEEPVQPISGVTGPVGPFHGVQWTFRRGAKTVLWENTDELLPA